MQEFFEIQQEENHWITSFDKSVIHSNIEWSEYSWLERKLLVLQTSVNDLSKAHPVWYGKEVKKLED
jgi:hypothetical protein